MQVKFFAGESITVWQEAQYSATELAGVNLKNDLKSVFEKDVIETKLLEADIVILEWEQFQRYSDLLSKLKARELIGNDGFPKWEAFLIQELDGQIYIVGSDMRGLIYGIYDFLSQIGVSPWHFFADVPIKKKQSYSIQKEYLKIDEPSIKYRGIFINDEEELNHWAQCYTDDGTIGPATYKRIFDLLLRLKANYIWPAMHVNFFNQNPENGRLADKMGIIFGTSHCDMLLRSNQHEWVPWLESQGYSDDEIKYDYSIPGKNRQALQDYWTGSVEMNKDYEVSYTVGMRGIHDTGFVTEYIDDDPVLSIEEKHGRKKELLEQVINDQRAILSKVLGEDSKKRLQLFVPYKEVLGYYDDGLDVPDEVTIMWANDNYGNIRRYPSLKEQKRSGGHGLYYHSSYWAPHNMHYLFINSTPLARMKNELQKAWDNGIRKMWVLNVGAIKPIEQDFEFYTRFAWEVGKETSTSDILEFLTSWIDRDFSGGIGTDVAKLLNDFTQAVNVRKIEMMDPDTFSQVGFGDEAARRLEVLRKLYEKSNVIAEKVLLEEKDAFFEIVQMKIHAAFYKNAELYFADRSCLAYKQGKHQAADRYHKASAEYTQMLRWMVHYYNKILADGKWDRILTPELAPPPNMKMYPPTKPALTIEKKGIGVVCWQGVSATDNIVLSGINDQKWIEIYNAGAGEINYTIDLPDWIQLNKTTGSVSFEERLFISILKEAAEEKHSGEIVISTEDAQRILVQVTYEPKSVLTKNSLEKDGAVSISLAKPVEMRNNNDIAAWQLRPYQGRYEGDAIEAWSPKLLAFDTNELSQAPQISYDFMITTDGCHLLEVYRQPSLNSVGDIRLGVSVDGGPIIIVSSDVTDEHRGKWEQAILDDVDKMYVTLPFVLHGKHRITFYMIDSYVCLSKAVIYTQGFIRTSLGPVSSDCEIQRSPEPIPAFAKTLWSRCSKIYHSEIDKVELPVVLYADQSFYNQYFIGGELERVKQTKLGPKSYLPRSNGKKDIVEDYLKDRPIIEKNGRFAFEAEQVLANDRYAYHSPVLPGSYEGKWEHIGAVTGGGVVLR